MANVPPERWGDEGAVSAPPRLPEQGRPMPNGRGGGASSMVAPAEKGDDVAGQAEAWPSAGAIEIQNLSMRYRPGLPCVLDGVSLSIRGGERVGICGRTGSGKSSLSRCLLRLNEFDGGEIMIDGRASSTLPLATLRRGMAMVQQDPSLFSGTLRHNVDPTALADPQRRGD